MNNPSKLMNTNRVKSITSKFEHLSERAVSPAAPSKNGVDVKPAERKPFVFRKTRVSGLPEEGADDVTFRSPDVRGTEGSRRKFGPSYNFGNRKRLKERDDDEKVDGVEPSDDGVFDSNAKEAALVRRSSLNFENSANSLSRQLSDPGKKLQRSPAFRCERPEKMKDTRKAFEAPGNSTATDKEKLKKLGPLSEKEVRQDNVEFSSMKKSNGPSDEKDRPGKNNFDDLFPKDDEDRSDDVSPHMIAQYAQVIKPKVKSAAKKSFAKTDAMFSDSGVSSESENIISDDLDENDSLKIQSGDFKSIRDNFESKGKGTPIAKTSKSKVVNPDNSLGRDESDGINCMKSPLLPDADDNKIGYPLTETLKKVLKQPLPPGPAPKKPPRTFAETKFLPNSDSAEKCLFPKQNSSIKSNKSTKSHRSKEESKLMLKKLENALQKRESSGKILSPRSEKRKESEPSSVETSVDQTPCNTEIHSSVETIKGESDKDDRKKEIHYMCTEIIDLNFSDKENILNSSDASLSSLDLSNSFTKCLNSLNCSGNSNKHSSLSYTKFGSTVNSNATSLSNVCCSCSLTREKSKDSTDSSAQNIRLSTFKSPSNRSLDLKKCKRCSSNEAKDNSFKCHVDCTCPDVVKNDESNSHFFLDVSQPNETASQYGSLKKDKPQAEHIYAEPYDYIRRKAGRKASETPISLPLSPPPVLTRTRTQLEDGFGKIREIDTSAKSPQTDEKFSPDNYFLKDSLSRMKTQRVRNNSESPPSTNASIKKYPFIRSKTRLEDGFGRIREANSSTIGDDKNKVKDVLARPESGRGSLKINKSALYSKEIPKVDADNSPKKGLYYMSTKIYDIPYNGHNEVPNSNSSFLYRQQFRTVPKRGSHSSDVEDGLSVSKPPLGDRRSSCDNLSKSFRPNSLSLAESRNRSLRSRDLLMRRGSPTEADREKLTHLMSEIYDTVAEACVLDSPSREDVHVHTDSDNNDASLKLSRSLTEKRKKYVRRVSCRTRTKDSISVADITKALSKNRLNLRPRDETDFVKSQDKGDDKAAKEDRLFNVCLLVGMNFATGVAFIKSKYPKNAEVSPMIESLVFPEAVDLSEDNNEHTRRATLRFKRLKCDAEATDIQNYSFVLTDEKGVRNHAYCRRVLPEGHTHTLPLSYCLITKHRAPSFYYKVLEEIESHHGSSDIVIDSILSQLHNATLPKSGYSVTIRELASPKKVLTESTFKKNSSYRKSVNLGDVFSSVSADDYSGKTERRCSTHMGNLLETKDSSLMKSFEKIYGQDLKEFKKILTEKSNERLLRNSNNNIAEDVNGNSEDVVAPSWTQVQIKRPLEPRLDENNLSVLYDSISINVLVKLFGSLLLERKIIIIGDKLSQLSSCLEAIQSILYPFVWQHTIISTIPAHLCRDLLEAPVPLLAGLLISDPVQNESSSVMAEIENIDFEEGMLIDISGSKDGSRNEKILRLQGDESTLLPPILAKTLTTSLQLGTSISATSGTPDDDHVKKARNVLVAEAFLRFFIEIMENYKLFFKVDTYGLTKPHKGDSGSEPIITFEREAFVKSHCSKHVQLFLEWFTETAMFGHFIDHKVQVHSESRRTGASDLPYPHFYDIFDERISHKEFTKRQRNGSKSNGSLSKHNYKAVLNKKVKVWKDKLKDLVN